MKTDAQQRTIVFVAIVVIAFVIWIIVQSLHTYRWTFQPDNNPNTEPFSTKVLDEVLKNSFSHGYRTNNNLHAELRDIEQGATTNLIVQEYANADSILSEQQWRRMVRLAARGRHILYSSRSPSEISWEFLALGRYCSPIAFSIRDFCKDPSSITLWWQPSRQAMLSPRHDAHSDRVRLYKTMLPFYINLYESKIVKPDTAGANDQALCLSIADMKEEIGKRNKRLADTIVKASIFDRVEVERVEVLLIAPETKEIYALRYCLKGGGTITVLTIDYVLSNYGMVAPDMRRLAERLLAPLSEQPVVRVSNFTYDSTEEHELPFRNSALHFFLKHPPLQLMVWLLALMGILAIVINARRRQRVVAHSRIPDNSSLDFLRQVTTLFRRKTDYTGLLRHEYRLLLQRLREEFRFDMLISDTCATDYLSLLSERCGWNKEETRHWQQILDIIQTQIDTTQPAKLLSRTSFLLLAQHLHILQLQLQPSLP